MIFKDTTYDDFNAQGNIFFSAIRYALTLKEFKEFVIEKFTGIEDLNQILIGCSKCWERLKEKIGKKGVVGINDFVRKLDKDGKVIKPKPSMFTNKSFNSNKEALEYLKNLPEYKKVIISVGNV